MGENGRRGEVLWLGLGETRNVTNCGAEGRET